jgi:hypothetical protein
MSDERSFAVQSTGRKLAANKGMFMRFARLVIAAALAGSAASAAQATTIVIFVEPMTLEHYTRVFDTPGRDRMLMCMAPPATSGCTEVPLKSARR